VLQVAFLKFIYGVKCNKHCSFSDFHPTGGLSRISLFNNTNAIYAFIFIIADAEHAGKALGQDSRQVVTDFSRRTG
jgi:hypothetical protein